MQAKYFGHQIVIILPSTIIFIAMVSLLGQHM